MLSESEARHRAVIRAIMSGSPFCSGAEPEDGKILFGMQLVARNGDGTRPVQAPRPGFLSFHLQRSFRERRYELRGNCCEGFSRSGQQDDVTRPTRLVQKASQPSPVQERSALAAFRPLCQERRLSPYTPLQPFLA